MILRFKQFDQLHLKPSIHQENMPVQYIPPYTPFLYSKTGVCRGIPIFLIFAPNIDCGYLLELPRRVPTIYVLSKNKKNIKINSNKIFNFYS